MSIIREKKFEQEKEINWKEYLELPLDNRGRRKLTWWDIPHQGGNSGINEEYLEVLTGEQTNENRDIIEKQKATENPNFLKKQIEFEKQIIEKNKGKNCLLIMISPFVGNWMDLGISLAKSFKPKKVDIGIAESIYPDPSDFDLKKLKNEILQPDSNSRGQESAKDEGKYNVVFWNGFYLDIDSDGTIQAKHKREDGAPILFTVSKFKKYLSDVNKVLLDGGLLEISVMGSIKFDKKKSCGNGGDGNLIPLSGEIRETIKKAGFEFIGDVSERGTSVTSKHSYFVKTKNV